MTDWSAKPCIVFAGAKDHSGYGRKWRNGRSATGAKNGRAKLTAPQVAEIRGLLRHGLSMHEIGRRFGVDWTTIRSLRDGETWTPSAAPSPDESPVGDSRCAQKEHP